MRWPPGRPVTASPQIDLRNGHPVLDFDDTANESTFFLGVLPSTYSAGGLQLKLTYCASTAATGTVSWGFAFERKQTGVQDIDGDGFGAESSADGAVASQAGVVSQVVATIPATSLSGAVAGEPFRLQVPPASY